MHRKGSVVIIGIIVVVLIMGFVGYFALHADDQSIGERLRETLSFTKAPKEIVPTSTSTPAGEPPVDTTGSPSTSTEVVVLHKGTLTPNGLVSGTLGAHYAMKITAHGFEERKPLEWRIIRGSLPTGLRIETSGSCFDIYGVGKGGGILTDNDTLICGLPEKSGAFTFVVQAKSVNQPDYLAEKEYVILIAGAAE
jgi:hypothetical protein